MKASEVGGAVEGDEHLSHVATEVASELGIVGAQVAVLKDDQIREGVAGSSSLSTGVPVTPDTLFQIGSTTKVFTAALVMQLIDDGLIGLDTPVVEQLPEFKLSDEVSLRTLTPRHLMSMSSGIENGPYTDYGRGDDAVAKYVAHLDDLVQIFRPGEAFGYSNASTIVSGRLIEHVTGQPWDTVLQTRLLEPAGLADSATLAEDIIWRRFAVGHELNEWRQPTRLLKWSLPRSMGPAGGTLCSTAGDLVRLAHVFVHDGRALNNTQVLSPKAVDRMQAHEVDVPPTLLAEWWGLGPYGKVWDGVEVMGHSGTQISGSSYLLWARDRRVAVATTVNVARFGYPFAARIFEVLFGEEAGIVVPRPPKASDEIKVDAARFVGRYAMCGSVLTVSEADDHLTIEASGELFREGDVPPSRLIPLTSTTFIPADPRIDGRRGWALAFIAPENDGPVTHLLNGFWAHRRIAP